MQQDNNHKNTNYEKLTDNSDIITVIKDGDVIIGMVNPKPATKEDEKMYKDSSTIYKSLVPGAIEKIYTDFNTDGYPIEKIRISSERIPCVGDMFSSRPIGYVSLTN